jgi:excinuclease ABC subunit C
MNGRKTDIEPEFDLADEDEEQGLPLTESDAAAEPQPPLAAGRAAIARYLKHAPAAPGVYRMLDAAGDILYVGKA